MQTPAVSHRRCMSGEMILHTTRVCCRRRGIGASTALTDQARHRRRKTRDTKDEASSATVRHREFVTGIPCPAAAIHTRRQLQSATEDQGRGDPVSRLGSNLFVTSALQPLGLWDRRSHPASTDNILHLLLSTAGRQLPRTCRCQALAVKGLHVLKTSLSVAILSTPAAWPIRLADGHSVGGNQSAEDFRLPHSSNNLVLLRLLEYM